MFPLRKGPKSQSTASQKSSQSREEEGHRVGTSAMQGVDPVASSERRRAPPSLQRHEEEVRPFRSHEYYARRNDRELQNAPPDHPAMDMYMRKHDVALAVEDGKNHIHGLHLEQVNDHHLPAATGKVQEFFKHLNRQEHSRSLKYATMHTAGSLAHQQLERETRIAAQEHKKFLGLVWDHRMYYPKGMGERVRPGLRLRFTRDGQIEPYIYTRPSLD